MSAVTVCGHFFVMFTGRKVGAVAYMGTLEEGERGFLPVPIPKCKEP